jgi:hypothetical protein
MAKLAERPAIRPVNSPLFSLKYKIATEKQFPEAEKFCPETEN